MLLQRATLPLFGVFLALLISEARGEAVKNKLTLVESWKALDFLYPTTKDRDEAIKRKEFIPGQLYPFDIAIHYDKNGTRRRIFVTIPRFQEGVPASLGYVTEKRSSDGNPLIAPYPDWKSQGTDACDMLINVWRIQIDRCGRLWVVDSGQLGGIQICAPQLLSFSLNTDKLLSRYRFKAEDYYSDSIFANPVVDVRGNNCKDTFVYVADAGGYGLVVYDHQNMRSWRVDNKLFFPYPEGGTFSINGYEFDMMDGVLGMALSPLTPRGDKILYFHSLSSIIESYVLTSVIRNYTLFHNDPGASPRSFVSFEKKRSSQSAAEAMDKNGVMYFGLMTDLAIACWNSQKYNYGDKNFERIAVDPKTLQYASGVNVVPKNDGREELWVLTISFQRYVAGTLSSKNTNFRIQVGLIDELIRGTKCDSTR